MYLASTSQIKTDSGKSDRLILVIDENQSYLIIDRLLSLYRCH